MTVPVLARRVSDPPHGVAYPLVLSGPDQTPMRPIVGVMLGILGFALFVPTIAQLVLRVTWLFRGRPPFEAYRVAAMAYEFPEGLVASHLRLAFLIVIAAALVRHLHGRSPVWLVSVQPGFRWRYLLICLLVAVVVLNGVMWASFLFLGAPGFQSAQPGWPWFLLVIVLFSPLQAAAEEFFFRGYVLQAIGSGVGGAWIGIAGSALLFAMFHGVQNPALFVDRLAFGLLAGWLVLRTGGLEAGIGAHVANNLFAFGYGIFTGGVAATKAVTEIGWDKAVVDVASFGLLALAAAWVGTRLNVATRTP